MSCRFDSGLGHRIKNMEKFTPRENNIIGDSFDGILMKHRKGTALKMIEVGLGEVVAENLDKIPEEDRFDIAIAIIEKIGHNKMDIVLKKFSQEDREKITDELINRGAHRKS